MGAHLLRITFYAFITLIGSVSYGQTETDYTLVWSDEFDYEGNPDPEKWHHQTDFPVGNSWFNGELQFYTDRTENSQVGNGVLKLVARKESYSDQGVTKDYTSARLNSKFAFTKGRVEVRAKIPSGAGTWPAIWTLGKNINEDGGYWDDQFGTTNWPACGEIDIMEHWGTNENFIQSAMHTPSSFGGTVNKGGRSISTATSAFHIYGLEWTDDKMIFDVDGVVHYIYKPSSLNDDTWPFDADQYLLLNIAIEGNMPSINSSFDQVTMEVDYVRVYQNTQESISVLPMFAAPVPSENETEVVSIYSDSYVDISNTDFSANGAAFFEEVIFNENSLLKYSTNEEEGGIQTIMFERSLNLERAKVTNFQFDVWFSETLNNASSFKIKIVNNSGDESVAEILIDREASPAISQGKWIAYDFTVGELRSMGLKRSDAISQIIIDVEDCNTVYLDNIYFYGASNSILGQEKKTGDQIKLYPNPVLNFIKINISPQSLEDYSIYDASGKTHNVSLSEGEHEHSTLLDVSKLKKGTYFIRLNTNKSTITKRFQKD